MLRGRVTVGFLLALTLALASNAAATPGEAQRTATGATAVTRVEPLEAHLLRQINSLRLGKGLGPLARSSALTRAAASHSEAMATLGFFEHASHNGTSLASRLERFYRPRSQPWLVGENLAMFGGGAPSAEAIVAAWMASPPHRANLLRQAYRDAGIGIMHHPSAGGVFGGLPTWVITLDVGRR
jgi:uncharacterized protein YkwD